jgi:hypothetical protein
MSLEPIPLGSSLSSRQAGAFSCPTRACRDAGCKEGLLQDVLLVRDRLPLGSREAEAGRSRSSLPGRELPPVLPFVSGIADPEPDL